MINLLALVSYPFLPARFGGQKAIAVFYRHLATKVNLVCVTTQKNDPNEAKGYSLLNILSNSPLRYINLFYFFRIKKIIREKQITHLLIEHPYYGWLGMLLQKYAGVRLIVRSHNIEGQRWKTLGKWWWKWLWRYERKVHRAAAFNFFIQEADMAYAINQFGLQPNRCIVVTYGTEIAAPPSAAEKAAAREVISQRHSIPAGNTILLFNGAFDYFPNLDGLQKIISYIHPLLQQQSSFKYSIIICGRGIPETILQQSPAGIIMAGFVEDISLYFKGAGIFINPVTEGGGIKTKLVEALGYNMDAVSTASGAIGVPPALCGNKLNVVADNDWVAFAKAITHAAANTSSISPAFFAHFNWNSIVDKAIVFISATT